MEQTVEVGERKYRTHFKQSAKGTWTGEFTVRADDFKELQADIKIVEILVIDTITELNGGTNNGEKKPDGD